MSKRLLPFATKNTDRKKQLEKEAYRLTEATLQYIEEQDMSPEEVETYLQEVEQKVRKLTRARGQRQGRKGIGEEVRTCKEP